MLAIEDANGVPEDMWFRILGLVGDKDASVVAVSCFGGRYYVTEAQRSRLRKLIPFMQGEAAPGRFARGDYSLDAPVIGTQLSLPPHIPDEHPLGIRCSKCKGVFHPASGHAFSATVVACGPCYGRFAAWQLQKYGWVPLTSKQLKKLNKAKNKAARKAEGAAKELAKRQAKEAEEREKLYGKPREAQTGQNSIMER